MMQRLRLSPTDALCTNRLVESNRVRTGLAAGIKEECLSAQDALSPREQEVLAELRAGGRVPSIAKRLSISRVTVRNHLQRIFWKLGVHSQSELIEHVREHPETLPDSKASHDANAEQRYWSANRRLSLEVDEILGARWGPRVLHEVVHRALPLSEAGREEWQARFAIWSRPETASEEHAARRASEMDQWHDGANKQIKRAQVEGWLRSDLSSEESLEQLFSLLVGVSIQLITDIEPTRSEAQVRVVDAFLDNLLVDDSKD
jgi:DNA-binding CsgD family transcriptional regulator